MCYRYNVCSILHYHQFAFHRDRAQWVQQGFRPANAQAGHVILSGKYPPLLQATIRARNPDAVERCGHKLGLASTLSLVDRRRVNILYSDCPPDLGTSTSFLQQKIQIIKRLIHRFSSALFNSLNLGNFIL